MSGYSQFAWLPLCGGLTLVGLILSWVIWRRRGAAAGLLAAAWSLLPIAVYLLGLTELLWRFGTAIASFAGSLVFSFERWIGVAVLGFAVVLFGVSRVLRSRRAGQPSKREGKGQRAEPGKPGVSGTSSKAVAPSSRAAGGGKAGAEDDLSDIEDILRRRGIR
jgi:hypothetical protein